MVSSRDKTINLPRTSMRAWWRRNTVDYSGSRAAKLAMGGVLPVECRFPLARRMSGHEAGALLSGRKR